MDKALLICLCIIMLIGASITGLTTFSSQAQAPAGGIIIENADYVSNKTTEYSADLINIAKNVTPRIIVQYTDSILEHGSQGSQDLIQVANAVTPRIIVEYADLIFRADLERPLFGAEVSASIDSYSISPRNVTVGDDVTIGFSFTNTGNLSWTFGAGATFRKPNGTQIDFLEAVTVNPGESGSAQWTYAIDMAGRWDIVFGVWKEYTHPLENFLDQTGWVPEYVTATVTAVDNQPPVADAGEDQTVNEDTLVTFDGSASSDNVGITSYTWTLTDVTLQTLTDVNPTYIFSTPGTYTVTLTVWDVAGNSDTDSIIITVLSAEEPPPPPAEAFPLWIVGAAVAIIAIATAAIAVFWRRRKQPPTHA